MNGEKQSKSEFPTPVVTRYTVQIPHGNNFVKRIRTLLCYWMHPRIAKSNIIVAIDKKKGSEDKEVYVVEFRRSIESENVVTELAVLDPPLKPATHEELLAFGKKHKDISCHGPVMQLGSSLKSRVIGRVVSGFCKNHVGRVLDEGPWSAGYGFLAVRA